VTKVEVATTNTIIKKGTYTQAPVFADSYWTPGSDKHTITSTDVSPVADVVLDTGGDPINDTDKFLMLIPQTIPKGSLTVTISYTITEGGGTVTYTTTTAVPTKDEGLQLNVGKSYTFNFVFGINSIIFQGVNIGGWTAADPQPGDTPL
jgi:hypothetical protein